MLAMPAAQGPFHKSIVEYDVLIKGLSRENAAATTTEILGNLDLEDEAALKEYVKSHMGVNDMMAGRVIEFYRRLHPSASRLDTVIGITRAGIRNEITTVAELKINKASAPVFRYEF